MDPKLLYAACQEDNQKDQNHQYQNTSHNILSSFQNVKYDRIMRVCLCANEHLVRLRIVTDRVDRTIGKLPWYHPGHDFFPDSA